ATGEAMNVGNLLKPMVGQDELGCIGAITLKEYQKYIKKDLDLEATGEAMNVGNLLKQMVGQDTISNIHGLRERCEHRHGSKSLMVP
nr:hypothetical protein [Tanacetum cinerariifolium]